MCVGKMMNMLNTLYSPTLIKCTLAFPRSLAGSVVDLDQDAKGMLGTVFSSHLVCRWGRESVLSRKGKGNVITHDLRYALATSEESRRC